MPCQCPIFSGDGGCLVHRLVLTARQREQCRSSEEFFDVFSRAGSRKGATRRDVAATYNAARAVSRRKTIRDVPCIYRGSETERVLCRGCSSDKTPVRVKAWQCALHRVCTLRDVGQFLLDGQPLAQACITCDDRQTLRTDESASPQPPAADPTPLPPDTSR